jgi:hypothetical protein
MGKLLLNLRHVPDDEADEIRAWLEENQLAFYETKPSRWGISAGGIWLQNSDDYPKARTLMDTYQQARYEKAQQENQHVPGWWEWAKQQPTQAIGVLLAIAGALVLMGLPAYILSR